MKPGTYRVAKGPEGTLRLRSVSGGAGTGILAIETTHGTNVEGPQAVCFDESDDARRVVLLLPERRSLEARGSPLLRLDWLMVQRDQLQQQVDEAIQVMQNMHVRIAEIEGQLGPIDEQRAELERILGELPPPPEAEQERQDLQTQIDNLNLDAEGLRQEIDTLHRQIQQREMDVANLLEEINQLDDRIMMLLRMVGG